MFEFMTQHHVTLFVVVLVIIGLLRYVMSSTQNAEAPKQSPPAPKQ